MCGQRSSWPQLQRQQSALLDSQQLDGTCQESGRREWGYSCQTNGSLKAKGLHSAHMLAPSAPVAVAAASGATTPYATGSGTGAGLALNAVTRWGSVCSRPVEGGEGVTRR